MTGILALDLSKNSTGWALLPAGTDVPRLGSWRLGSEYTSDGGVFAKLLRCLGELRQVAHFEHAFFEQKINPAKLQGYTTIDTINLLSGLEATVKLFAHAKRLRTCKAISIDHWRGDFIGSDLVAQIRAEVRRARKGGDAKASGRKDLKWAVKERCRQLGFNPANDDEADALGILTYAILLRGETPPWLANEVLREPLAMAGAR